MRYFIGGYTWNRQSQFERFISDGIWENGYEEDKYSELFSEISIGDYFALKSTYVLGRKPDAKSYLRISQIGIVTEILSKSSIKIDWITNEEFDLTDIKWYANTLEEISFEGDINRIFSQTKYMAKMKENIDILNYKKQIILQGPPGTGKTREAKLLAEELSFENIPENISFKQIGDIIYKGLILKTKENYSFRIKEVDKQIKRILIIPESAPINEYPVTFDQILKCYESKGWKDKISHWNQNGNASYLVSLSKYIYDFLIEKNKETVKIIQFHPSYTYEDFVRGIVAESNGDKIEYKNVNKTLGEFAETALNNYNISKENVIDNNFDSWIDAHFELFKEDIAAQLPENEIALSGDITIYDVTDNSFKYGKNWKTASHILFGEFKNLIRAILKNELELSNKQMDKDKFRHAHYRYTYYNALLENFFQEYKYESNGELIKEKKYILIIDEINRANLSSVLGELIYALEYRNETVHSSYGIKDENNKVNTELILPSNLYIIGTMNTADRSVGHIDYAIRRRFAFVDVLPEKLEDNTDIFFNTPDFVEVAKLFIKAGDDDVINFENAENSDFLSNDFSAKDVALGHSYFVAEKKKVSPEEKDNYFKMKMKYEVVPILNEYLKDGVFNESATAKIKEIEQRFA